jgi:septum site-determining protein MinC
MANATSIKGTREGLTITLGVGEVQELISDLTQHLATQGAFFRGGHVALEIGGRALASEDLQRLGELLRKHDMILRTVVTNNGQSQQAAQGLGLRVVSSNDEGKKAEEPEQPRTTTPAARALEGSRGILIRHVVRSGQVVRHTGHVVIVGDVNIGGTVSAGGDIIVWGRLYGIAHAGAMGDESAVVCALQMSPMQLRIGKLVARPEENVRNAGSGPEIAYVRDAQILVEPWDKAPRGV